VGLAQDDDDDTTRAVARLPGLDIAVEHRRLPNAEAISIHLQAMPSFAAFGDFLDSANPFAFWARAAQLSLLPWLAWSSAWPPVWSPWLDAARALLPPGSGETPPTVPEG
jgi:hypothetical protein